MTVQAADGARINYRVDEPSGAGAPDTVVFINSLGTSMSMWDAQAEALGRRLRVVRYDFRGHGASAATPGPYTIDLLGGDLVALLDALELPRVHLCGLSLGGLIALWLASHHPQRVDRAVFANTAAKIGSTPVWNARIAAVESGGMAAVTDAVLGRFLSSGFRAAHPDVAESVRRMVQGTDPRGYAAACAAVRNADLHPVLSKIHAPSLVVTAEWDESTPPAQGEELHKSIPGSAYVLLGQSAHLSNVEQRDRFTAAVGEFLGGAA